MPVLNGGALRQCPAHRAYVESSRSAMRTDLTGKCASKGARFVGFYLFFQPQNRCSIQSHTTVSRHLALEVPLPAQQARLLLLLQSDRNPSHTHTGDTGQSGTIQTLTKKHSRSHSLAEQFRKTRTTLQKKSLKRLLLHDYLSLQGLGGSIHQLLHLVWVRPDDLPHHLLALDEEERRHGLHSVPG